MRRIATLILAVTVAFVGSPTLAHAASPTGAITGIARASGGAPFASHTARLRSVQTGDIVSSTATSALGSFEFSSVAPGSYVIEIVDVAGKVVGISGVTAVSAGLSAVATVTAATPVVGGALATPLIVLLLAAGGAGAVGVWAATKNDASPSR